MKLAPCRIVSATALQKLGACAILTLAIGEWATQAKAVEPAAKQVAPKPRTIEIDAPLVARHATAEKPGQVLLCQKLGPAAPVSPPYIDCADGYCRPEQYNPTRPMPWQMYAQGEYVGHARTRHVPEYRLRVDDVLECIYRLTREQTTKLYQLNVGDEIRVESFSDPNLNRESLVVQPDGMVTLRLLGDVRAAGKNVPQLREELEQLYTKYYKEPSITVTPTKVNTKLEDLRDAVITRFGFGGQIRTVRVIPDGTISLPAVGAVPALGLTLTELKAELDARYRETIEGIEVVPALFERAPRSVFVLGEVRTPGRQVLTGPTTLMQAVSMAGGWNVGANLRNVIIFRRGDDWRLLATRVDMWAPLMRGAEPCPAGELWLSDSDVVLVPKMAALRAGEWADLLFTRGIYRVVPMNYAFSLGSLGTL
ncbi:MAG: polysaccharide biosynthesis/export family protein [Pirellulales bacterium]